MVKFYKVESADNYKTPTIINIEHISVIQPLGNGDRTSIMLDNGTFYTVDIPFNVEEELLSEYIINANVCTDNETIRKSAELHEQFKEVFHGKISNDNLQ